MMRAAFILLILAILLQEKELLALQKSRERWLYNCGHLICKSCMDGQASRLKQRGQKNQCPTCLQEMPRTHCHAFGKVFLGG